VFGQGLFGKGQHLCRAPPHQIADSRAADAAGIDRPPPVADRHGDDRDLLDFGVPLEVRLDVGGTTGQTQQQNHQSGQP
jgi:hypothetical protein